MSFTLHVHVRQAMLHEIASGLSIFFIYHSVIEYRGHTQKARLLTLVQVTDPSIESMHGYMNAASSFY